MAQEMLPYAELLDRIKSQLTGDPEKDRAFLNEQALRYRGEPWARPFLREIGRLVFDLMTPGQAEEATRAVRSDMKGWEALRHQAWEDLEQGRLDDAERRARQLLEAVSMFGSSDLDTAYLDFEDLLEETYFRLTREEPPLFLASPVPHQPAMILLASVLEARDDLAGSLDLLNRAAARAPVSVLPRFLRLNLLKRQGEVEQAFQEGLAILPLCHRQADLAQAYRHLGWCLADQQRWQPAAAALVASLHHDWSALGLREIGYVLERSGGVDLEGCARSALDLLEGAGIPVGPDARWSEAAREYLAVAGQAGDEEGEALCREVLSAMEPPDFASIARRLQEERARPPADVALEATAAGRYLRSLQAALLGWASRRSAEEGQATLARELEQASASGESPFWVGEVGEVDWDQGLLFAQPILEEMGPDILEAARALGFPAVPLEAWGELPLGALKARVLAAPGGERIPVVSTGWMLFSYLLSKVVASALPVVKEDGEEGLGFDQEEIAEHLRRDPRASKRFVELMVAAGKGDPSQAPTWILGGPAGPLASMLCQSAELFLLAEQSLLAALAEGPSQGEQLSSHLAVERLAPDEQTQIQAAVLALQVVLRVQQEQGISFDLCVGGVLATLYGAALVEELTRKSKEDLLSAGVRFTLLLELLQQKVPQAMEVPGALVNTLSLLWENGEWDIRKGLRSTR